MRTILLLVLAACAGCRAPETTAVFSVEQKSLTSQPVIRFELRAK